MIKYKNDLFGIKTLFIWHGSAVFRAIVPAAVSTVLMFFLKYYLNDDDDDGDHLHHASAENENITQQQEDRRVIQHTYTITVFIAFFSFLLAFRLNYAYQRYWEACTHVHQMSSKWLDAAILVASFHYQCAQYDTIRPLTFGANPKIRNETREREHLQKMSFGTMEELIEHAESKQLEIQQGGNKSFFRRILGQGVRRRHRRRENRAGRNNIGTEQDDSHRNKTFQPNRTLSDVQENHFGVPNSDRSTIGTNDVSTRGRMDQMTPRSNRSDWRISFGSSYKATKGRRGKSGRKRLLRLIGLDTPVPSLFLQEAAHLFSLLSAVAMATLRADIQGTLCPLSTFIPGAPFPPVNPDELSADIKKEYFEESPFWTCIYFLLGMRRSPAYRTLYNAARPFKVIGGVSDGESEMLLKARGPYAQMALCNMWLKEFVSREYLNGSTGKVAPPIIGRIYQFISDGVTGYNQSRKIAFVPFPFPHAQMTVFFKLTILFLFPCLYHFIVNDRNFAYVMNFTTVLCFVGIHEVARELENPYYTFPNDLPLNNFQAQFNEALVTMYAGFHPDSYREQEQKEVEEENENEIEDNEEEEEEEENGKDQGRHEPQSQQNGNDEHDAGIMPNDSSVDEEEKIEEC